MIKRFIDIILSAIGLVLLSPVFIALAIVIKRTSPGPVFYRAMRAGKNFKPFRMFKFRSMVANADQIGGENSPADDPRLTEVGKFMKRYKLDELPQLINVLKGEMSLVGTRPPIPDEVEHYEDWHRRRISIKPGITGLWQVSGRKEITDFSQVVKLDLKYIDNWRFRHDFWYLWKTIWAILAGKGAK